MKRFYLENLGCSKNAADGEVAIVSLIDRGYVWTKNPAQAEILILNTCGFIEAAVQESLDRLMDLASYKSQGSAKKLVLMGCLSQRYQDTLASEIPEVDVLVGTGYLKELADVLESGKRLFFDKRDTLILSGMRPKLTTPYAYIKIAEGCDNHCTYCLIPSLRGPMRSRSIEDILQEARGLLKQGASELILIAQDVSRFGTDRGENLQELLLALNGLEGNFWIRLQYVYSDILTREFFETMAQCEKVVPYLDMPIQHISDRVLRRMNRKTSKAEITKAIGWAREVLPGIALRTTVMVGFPGETEKDFQELMDFLAEHPFERLGAFMYSDEEGAPSQKLSPKISQKVKEQRFDRLMQAQMERAEALSLSRVGSLQTVLVDEIDEGVMIGRTQWDAPDVDCLVFIDGETAAPGDFLPVRITRADSLDLIGELHESTD